MCKMKYMLIAIVLLSSHVCAKEVRDFNKTDVDVLLENLSYSVNENDLEEFLQCFSVSKRDGLRRKAATMFLLHPEVRMSVDNYYVLSENEDQKEIMIRYELANLLIVSEMNIIKENEKLVLLTETIKFKEDKFSHEGILRKRGNLSGVLE